MEYSKPFKSVAFFIQDWTWNSPAARAHAYHPVTCINLKQFERYIMLMIWT
jgi:hypothetical protein